MISVIFAHPYQSKSRANRKLLEAISDLPNTHIRSLYDIYPDFDVDVPNEQKLLEQSNIIVWMHPIYWYSVPGLLKHYFDKVLSFGWAYGGGAAALRGKQCLWVTTTGGDEGAYSPDGSHERPFGSFVPPVEQIARYCGMIWRPPFVVHGVSALDDEALAKLGSQLRRQLDSLRASTVTAEAAP